jgi:hypothetical protein
MNMGRLELVGHERLLADDPCVVARFDHVGVPGSDISLA